MKYKWKRVLEIAFDCLTVAGIGFLLWLGFVLAFGK